MEDGVPLPFPLDMATVPIVVWSLVSIIFVVGVIGIYRSAVRKTSAPRTQRGVKPGRGDSLSAETGAGIEDSHSAPVRVPKDPIAYGKFMMPTRKN